MAAASDSILNDEIDVDEDGVNVDDIMKSITEGAKAISLSLLPKKSAEKYLREYDVYSAWRKNKKIPGNTSTEDVLLVYFGELQAKYKPNTLWVKYSMLRTTILRNEDTDIVYPKLIAYLKQNCVDYIPKRAKSFESHQIAQFLYEGDDKQFLCTKVLVLFGVFGAMRSSEFMKLRVTDVIEKDDIFLINVMQTKTRVDRSFTVQSDFAQFVRRYKGLRKPGTPTDRFFVNFENGKCTVQPIGKNKFYDTPKVVAAYLGLENPKDYTGHSLRRTSATVLVDGGGDMSMLMTLGGWRSFKTAGLYVDKSMVTKSKINGMIDADIKKRSSTVLSPISMEASSSYQESTSTVFSQSVVRYKENKIEMVPALQVGQQNQNNIEMLPKLQVGKENQNKNEENQRVTKFDNLKDCTFNFHFY